MNDFIKIRRDLHQIPELGFQEFETQKYLLRYLKKIKSDKVIIETWKTGILVYIKGERPNKTIAWRTDIDGLPILEETNCDYQSIKKGKMHACGHDCHMAIALGLLTYYVKNKSQNNLLFIFQPAEEEPGGAKPMMESDIFKKWQPDEIYALHVAPEYPVGTVATKEGVLFANSVDFDITLVGKGGHGAYPHLGNDMIIAMSHLITQLQSIVSRNMNPVDDGVVTVGHFKAGEARNIIAKKAKIEGTIRSLTTDAMNMCKKRIKEIAEGVGSSFGCKVEIEFKHDYYQVYNHEKETKAFKKFIKNEKNIHYAESNVAMTSEDFGYFLKEIPGCMFWLGVDSEYGLHESKFNPDERAIPLAINLLIDFFKYLDV